MMLDTELQTSKKPIQELYELKQAKKFVTEFPKLRNLLNQLKTNEEIGIAGQLIKTINNSEIVARQQDLKTIKIALTGNFVFQPIEPFLKYFHLRENILVDTHCTDYGQHTYEIFDSGSELYNFAPAITVCLLDEHFIFDELSTPWNLVEIEQILQEKSKHLERLITRYTNTSQGLLILNTLPLSENRIKQLVDYKSKATLSYLWKEFNARLLKLSTQFKSLIVIDLEPMLANGVKLSDERLSQYAKMHMSEPLLCNYAREISKISRVLVGQTKKCLVLDLDNTLWKGILGDDGIEGIEVAETFAGQAHHNFQCVVKQLASQGVLLAVSSKNDREKVLETLQNHPQMVLRQEDFVKICANWKPKHQNIQAIAESINLNLDSFVFVDDSEFERNLVRLKLPSVEVPEIKDDPAVFASTLLENGWFNTLEITNEDYSRGLKYKNEVERKDFLDKFDSINDYLKELQIKVRLFSPQPAEIARICQLILRTNQFNLTTIRYQEADIMRMLADPLATIVGIQAQDRFGDNGIVGCIIAHQSANNKSKLHIDNFLLSCRVFSRGIETISLKHFLQTAKNSQIERVSARYSPTAKNQKVADFYKQQGFEVVEKKQSETLYECVLNNIDIDCNNTHIELEYNYGDFDCE
jgi:FkbH-like protein